MSIARHVTSVHESRGEGDHMSKIKRLLVLLLLMAAGSILGCSKRPSNDELERLVGHSIHVEMEGSSIPSNYVSVSDTSIANSEVIGDPKDEVFRMSYTTALSLTEGGHKALLDADLAAKPDGPFHDRFPTGLTNGYRVVGTFRRNEVGKLLLIRADVSLVASGHSLSEVTSNVRYKNAFIESVVAPNSRNGTGEIVNVDETADLDQGGGDDSEAAAPSTSVVGNATPFSMADCGKERQASLDAEANSPPSSHSSSPIVVRGDFPFDWRRGPNCTAFPADIDSEAAITESTSQCNRALLAEALLGCVDWSPPAIPKSLSDRGMSARVIEKEAFDRLQTAAAAKDWLRVLSILAKDDLVEYPSYSNIANITSSLPKFEFVITPGNTDLPEFLNDPDRRFTTYRRCVMDTNGPSRLPDNEPCEGETRTSGPRGTSGLFYFISVNNECPNQEMRNAEIRSDNEGWVASTQFSTCSYELVPVIESDYYSGNFHPRESFDQVNGQEAEQILAKAKYREISPSEGRSRLFALYKSYWDARRAAADQQSADVYLYLNRIRRFYVRVNNQEKANGGDCNPFRGHCRTLFPYHSTSPRFQ